MKQKIEDKEVNKSCNLNYYNLIEFMGGMKK